MCKPHISVENVILPAAIVMVKAVRESDMRNKLKYPPLRYNTMPRRIYEMANDFSEQFK
jgi:hypothetical protein